MAELQTAMGDSLRVHPEGAKIEVTLGNTLILGAFIRGDGKQGITHPCTPIFGPDRKNLYGLKQHGNLRNEVCAIRETNDSLRVMHTITDTGYPEGMHTTQILKISSGIFHFTMTHTNSGYKSAAVNAGEHCYFDAPQGFAGTIINGIDITDLIKNNYDGATIRLKEMNTIHIPGKPPYILTQTGLAKAVVWVGKNPDTKIIDQTYVCIEPVEEDPFGDFFGSPESMLGAGESRSFTFTLHIK